MEESVPDTPNARAAEIEDAETVATVLIPSRTQQQQTPQSQRFFTQPTQIIERTPGNEPKSVVQVAASSPFGPSSSPSRPRAAGGILSTVMAPSGTAFRPPAIA